MDIIRSEVMNNTEITPNNTQAFNGHEDSMQQQVPNQMGQAPNQPRPMQQQAPNQMGQMPNQPRPMQQQAPNQMGQVPNQPRPMQQQAPNQMGQVPNQPRPMQQQAPNQMGQMPNQPRPMQQQVPNQMGQMPNHSAYGYQQSMGMTDNMFKLLSNISLLLMGLGTLVSMLKFISWANLFSFVSNMFNISSKMQSSMPSYFGGSDAAKAMAPKFEFASVSMMLMTIVLFTVVIFIVKSIFELVKQNTKYNTIAALIGGISTFTVLLFMTISVAIISSKTQGVIGFGVFEWIFLIIGLLASAAFTGILFVNKQNTNYWRKLTTNQLTVSLIVAGFDAFVSLLLLIAFATI